MKVVSRPFEQGHWWTRAPLLLVLLVLLQLTLSCSALGQEFPWPKQAQDKAKLEVVYEENAFFEGPTWDPAGKKLYFTSFQPKKTRILRLDGPGKATPWMLDTQGINGTCLSRDGRLLCAQAYGHRVLSLAFRAEPTDAKILVFDESLHQPNDVCQAPNGDLYYSDPEFGQKKTSAVYRLTPGGEITKVVTDMPVPNGVLTSPDGRTLYVSDSHERHWKAYPIGPDGTVGPGRIFFDPQTDNRAEPDGMTGDAAGNLYFTGRGGVWVVSAAGQLEGFIPLPEFCSNATFGGPTGHVLYLTCAKKVYSLPMNVQGVGF